MERQNPADPWTHPTKCWQCVIDRLLHPFRPHLDPPPVAAELGGLAGQALLLLPTRLGRAPSPGWFQGLGGCIQPVQLHHPIHRPCTACQAVHRAAGRSRSGFGPRWAASFLLEALPTSWIQACYMSPLNSNTCT